MFSAKRQSFNCNSERPKQDGKMGQWEGFEQEMSSPTPGKKTPCDEIVWGLFDWGTALFKRPWGSRQQDEHEPSVCSCRKETWQHLGLRGGYSR